MTTATTNPEIVLTSGIVVTAADIASALQQTDATAAGLNASVNACTTIDPLLKAQWAAFYDGYQKFSKANQGLGFFTLGLPNIGDQVVAYEGQLDMWSDVISRNCANFQPPPGQTHDPANQGLGTGTKWLIGAGIAAVGLVVLSPLISDLAIALRARRELKSRPRPSSDQKENPVAYKRIPVSSSPFPYEVYMAAASLETQDKVMRIVGTPDAVDQSSRTREFRWMFRDLNEAKRVADAIDRVPGEKSVWITIESPEVAPVARLQRRR